MTKGELEKLIRMELARFQDTQPRIDLNHKTAKQDDFSKTTNSNQSDLPNNRDQIHVIYDI